jgi:hypothetical protein
MANDHHAQPQDCACLRQAGYHAAPDIAVLLPDAWFFNAQHYAFQVNNAEFDAIFWEVKNRGV